MASTSSELSRTYTSFSGADINIVIDGKPVGSAVAVSYAIQREKGPVFVLGRADPLAFSRGKRGIAGTIVSLMLDEHWILGVNFENNKFVAERDELFARPGDLNNASPPLADLEELDPGFTFDSSDLSDSWVLSNAWYPDQLPPFDIVIVAVNEYGKAATMRIYGVELLNEGSGFSVDDMRIENQQSFIARTILPWQKLGNFDMDSGVFNPE